MHTATYAYAHTYTDTAEVNKQRGLAGSLVCEPTDG